MSLSPEDHNVLSNNKLQENQYKVLAQNCPQDKVGPDLQQIISAWVNLPEGTKETIKNLIEANNKTA